MPLTDLPLEELERYAPVLDAPEDLAEFWATTLDEARRSEDRAVLRPVTTPVRELVVEDLTFPGFGGEPVRGWVVRPRREGRLPCVVEYIGYGGGRGLPAEKLQWAAAGYVHVVMDTRGQGSGWGSGGDTPDPHGAGPAVPGFMTRGIERPETYYYRRVFTDAVRLLDAVRDLPFVDPARVAVTGASQGGGIALAAAALAPEHVAACLPDVPFLCHFRRAVALTPEPPFTEISRYLAVHRGSDEAVFRTLSYVDAAVLARWATAPALFSVALMDGIVLPSTVYAAFHAYAGAEKAIEVYAWNGHEGGQVPHWVRQAEWLSARF
ncbi:acetylxylan esterase [Cellulomonas endophytica]|uniref:acetylxylan esterase n=1 Tax=Cellulomonas endophytica TaxID=2494735 RepID=UPI00101047F1|nr:acetylxylan esterase [Cellulomonas endophytica]